ncbi:MAG TPA: hypothetical protein VGC21_05485 [Telluria sp.]|jgi:hypothetical protein
MRINPDYLIVGLIVLTILALNARATWLVLRDDLSERVQQITQFCMVWLFPLFGALLVLAVHRKPQKPSGNYRKRDDDADDYGVSGRPFKALSDALDD